MRDVASSVNGVLDDRLRAVVAALAEALIPGGAGLPGAGEVEVAGELMDRVFALRADLAAAVRDVAARAEQRVAGANEGRAAVFLDELAHNDRPAFDVFSEAVAGAYLLADRVRNDLGYPGQRAVPFDTSAARAQVEASTRTVVTPPLHGSFGAAS